MRSRRQLPLNGLRSFEAAARHLHMGLAATELGVTQGAISQQVKALEKQLGVSLFERSANRLHLSAVGVRLLPALKEAFDQIAAQTSNLDPSSLQGELVVACTPSALGNWLLKGLPAFWELYPDISLRFEEITAMQKHIPSTVEIAICYGMPDIATERVSELMHYSLFPVCSPAYLHRHPLPKPENLSQVRLLCDDDGSEWQRWFSETGLSSNKINKRLELPMNFLALESARLGLGVALADELEVGEALKSGSLVRLFQQISHESSQPYLIVQPEHPNARAQVFINWLRGYYNL